MIKKSILLLQLVLLTTWYSCAQQGNTAAFERDLQAFRYSLYADLEKVDAQKLMSMKFEPSDTISLKVNEFYEKNKKRIYEYRASVLGKYTDTSIAWEKYETDTEYTKSLKKIPEELWETLEVHALKNLFFIYPLHQAEVLIMMVISRHVSASEVGEQARKNQIGQPRIQTKKISKTQWEINVDKYRQVFKFTYDSEKGTMQLIKILKRKTK